MIMAADRLQSVIAANLRREMNRLGISQLELSRRAGIHAPDVSNFVRGTKDIRVSTLEKLAHGLGVHCFQLLLPEMDAESHSSGPVASGAA